MGGESLSFAGVEHHYLIGSIVAENGSPCFLDSCIEPHKFVFAASLNFAVIFSVEKFELVLEWLGWGLSGDEDNAQSAFGAEADIFGTFVVHFGDWMGIWVHISVIHCLVALESRELPPPGTNTSE